MRALLCRTRGTAAVTSSARRPGVPPSSSRGGGSVYHRSRQECIETLELDESNDGGANEGCPQRLGARRTSRRVLNLNRRRQHRGAESRTEKNHARSYQRRQRQRTRIASDHGQLGHVKGRSKDPGRSHRGAVAVASCPISMSVHDWCAPLQTALLPAQRGREGANHTLFASWRISLCTWHCSRALTRSSPSSRGDPIHSALLVDPKLWPCPSRAAHLYQD